MHRCQCSCEPHQGRPSLLFTSPCCQVFFRELPVNVLNLISDEAIHKIARLSIADTIVEMDRVFGANHEIIYWLLDLMVRPWSLPHLLPPGAL